jgi:MFS family permease
MRRQPLPTHLRWLLLFQAFNAVNFTIALGAPLVLTAQYLGAGPFYIGLLNALTPLLAGLNFFVTRWVDRLGYQEVLIRGWTFRSIFLLFVIPLPFLVGHAPEWVLVWGLVFPLVIFNVIRGLTAGAWFPWLTQIVPTENRGYFFGVEQRVINISALITLVGCGWFLGTEPEAWRYATLFFISLFFGVLSPWALRQVKTPVEMGPAPDRPPGLSGLMKQVAHIWRYRPYRRAMRFVTIHNLGMFAVPAFVIYYLRAEVALPDGIILKLQAMTTLGVLITSVAWGQLSDRMGSKPLLRISVTAMMIIVGYWTACATGIIVPNVWVIGGVFLLWGVFTSAHAVSQFRLILGSTHKGDLTMSIAWFQVLMALTGGLGPMVWGALIEGLRTPTLEVAGPESIAFTVFFGGALLLGLVTQFFLSPLPEPKAVSTPRVIAQVVWDWPVKVVSGIAGLKMPKRKNK